MNIEDKKDIKSVGSLLLDIGTVLMSSGATTERIRITVNRISGAFGYTTELLITNRALMLTISSRKEDYFFNSLKRTSAHGVNFRVVSGISRMSWRIIDEKWTLEQIRTELNRLIALPHYNRLIILGLVGVAGASFCRIFGGDALEMVVTFIATVSGLFIRQEAMKLKFNAYLCIFFAALTASLISGLFRKLGVGTTMEHAFTACVLFLIPGVPLINTFTDFIDSNILNGMVRCIHALMIALSIALGLLTSMILYGF